MSVSPTRPATDVGIRHATLADAVALARVAEACFRETFGPSNSAADMEAYCRETYGEALQGAEIANPGMVTLLAESAGELIGLCQLHPLRHSPCVAAARPLEIYRLYVRGDWHGARVGHRLMEAARREAVDRGCDVIWLGVWEHNPRAIAFYRRQGFTVVGEQPFQLGTDTQRDLVMRVGLAVPEK